MYARHWHSLLSIQLQEKLAVAIPLPGRQKILVNNQYLCPDTFNFPQRVGFSDLEVQTKFQQFEIIFADLNVHDPL